MAAGGARLGRVGPGQPISAGAWNALVAEVEALSASVRGGGAGVVPGRRPGVGLTLTQGVLGVSGAGALPMASYVYVTTVRGNPAGDVPANISYVVAMDRDPTLTIDTLDANVDLISRDCRSTDAVLLRPAVVGCVGLAWRWDLETRQTRLAVWLPMGERGEVKVYSDECGA